MTTAYAFTKVVVDDLDKMSAFYSEVYGLKQYDRVQSVIGEEPIEEIMLGTTDANTGGVILLKFIERKPAKVGEIILGFLTDDVDALYERVLVAGGGVHAPVRHDDGAPYKVGFVKDPEGHLAEVVELLDA
jgi:predicted enzyme related to lactoylglutathione lyase